MRVLVENNGYAPLVTGGAELSVQGIAEEFAVRGHEVFLLTAGFEDEDEELGGVYVVRRRMAALMSYPEHLAAGISPKKVVNKLLTIDNPLNDAIIEHVMDQLQPQVVLSNNLLGVTPALWRVAKRRGIGVMHTTRDFSLLCPNSTLICRSRPQCVQPKLLCQLIRRHMRRETLLVDTVCAPSHYALNVYQREGFFPRSRTCVIRNAVRYDMDEVAKRIDERRAAKPSAILKVCYLGRLVAEKGIGTLLDAYDALDRTGVAIEIHFAGSGELEQEIRHRADAGMRFVCHGFLPQDEVKQLLSTCEVLVAPSICAETYGRVALDAAAHAMPAVVSDAGALPEVLAEGSGMVFESGNAEALARCLEVYARNSGLVLEHGFKGANALLSYSISEQAECFERELTRIVSSC